MMHHQRTFTESITKYVMDDRILLAYVKVKPTEEDGLRVKGQEDIINELVTPIGCISYNLDYDTDKKICKLGILCVAEGLRKAGVGKMLIERVEELAKEHCCQRIKLSILEPRDKEHNFKKFLSQWF